MIILFFSCYIPHKQPKISLPFFTVLLMCGNQPQSSHIFKAIGKSPITLYGAGNETVSFQLVLKNIHKRKFLVTLQAPDLRGEGEQVVGREHMQFYSLENCQGAYSPDCLVPMVDNTRIVMGYGDSEAGNVLWVDFRIPPSIPPGLYEGALTVSVDGVDSALLVINLHVFPFSLPARPSIEADLNNYGVGFVEELGAAIGSQEVYRL